MKVLIDTNIILDWLMSRSPFYENAKIIMKKCFADEIDGYVTSHTFTDLFYILRKNFSVEERKKALLLICKHFQIIVEDKTLIFSALSEEKYNDLEDGLQMIGAYLRQLDYIVTRDTSDFKNSRIPAVSPEDFLNLFFSERS